MFDQSTPRYIRFSLKWSVFEQHRWDQEVQRTLRRWWDFRTHSNFFFICKHINPYSAMCLDKYVRVFICDQSRFVRLRLPQAAIAISKVRLGQRTETKRNTVFGNPVWRLTLAAIPRVLLWFWLLILPNNYQAITKKSSFIIHCETSSRFYGMLLRRYWRVRSKIYKKNSIMIFSRHAADPVLHSIYSYAPTRRRCGNSLTCLSRVDIIKAKSRCFVRLLRRYLFC